MDYSAPQIAGRDEPFRSAIREHLKGHTQGLYTARCLAAVSTAAVAKDLGLHNDEAGDVADPVARNSRRSRAPHMLPPPGSHL
jgi:hypothetical protein